VADGTLLDRESAASHNITVRATSADGSFSTQAFTITLSDVDEFDTSTVSDTDAAANAVNENAANGTVVGITALATDSDATTNTVTYTLDDTAGGRFAIDAVTGIVTVADGTLLDRESAASHNIIVRATSADGSSSTQAFTINRSTSTTWTSSTRARSATPTPASTTSTRTRRTAPSSASRPWLQITMPRPAASLIRSTTRPAAGSPLTL
jgi:hypothetical protein